MLDAVGEYLEEHALPVREHRASAGMVVGIVTLVCYTLMAVVLLVELL